MLCSTLRAWTIGKLNISVHSFFDKGYYSRHYLRYLCCGKTDLPLHVPSLITTWLFLGSEPVPVFSLSICQPKKCMSLIAQIDWKIIIFSTRRPLLFSRLLPVVFGRKLSQITVFLVYLSTPVNLPWKNMSWSPRWLLLVMVQVLLKWHVIISYTVASIFDTQSLQTDIFAVQKVYYKQSPAFSCKRRSQFLVSLRLTNIV